MNSYHQAYGQTSQTLRERLEPITDPAVYTARLAEAFNYLGQVPMKGKRRTLRLSAGFTRAVIEAVSQGMDDPRFRPDQFQAQVQPTQDTYQRLTRRAVLLFTYVQVAPPRRQGLLAKLIAIFARLFAGLGPRNSGRPSAFRPRPGCAY